MRIFVGLVVCGISLLGQTEFEVASVKPSGTEFRGTSTSEGGGYAAKGVTLKTLIASAYGVPEFRVEGGPGWMDSARWDIEARANVAGRWTESTLNAALAKLLEQRFQLRVLHESKDANVYFLDVAKSGVKMKLSAADAQPMLSMADGFVTTWQVTMARLAETLTRLLGRSVIDRTGLSANYEVFLSWTPEAGEGDQSLRARRTIVPPHRL